MATFIDEQFSLDHSRLPRTLYPFSIKRTPLQAESNHILNFYVIVLTMCFVFGTFSGAQAQTGEVVGGTVEPDYRYPWVVRLPSNGCSGVLIEPRWVLTAAHCVTPLTGSNTVSYHRTDPYTGTLSQASRGPDGVGTSPNPGAYLHPWYNPFDGSHDIALVRLAGYFTITTEIQTVGLPKTPRQANMVGTVVNFSHTMQLPEGQVAVFRAPIPPDLSPYKFSIRTTDASGSLCSGDSGSGFVTEENFRAIVRGIAAQVTITPDCRMFPSPEVDFTDVFSYRDWILETMRTVDDRLSGTTRVHKIGIDTRGVMSLTCDNPYSTMAGPLYVHGVEVGANCNPDEDQSVVCHVDHTDLGTFPMRPAIMAFKMITTCGQGTSVQDLPLISDTFAFFGGSAPAGICTREFTCYLGYKPRQSILDVHAE